MDDPGVATERTTLAWERTALSVMCAAAIVTRLTFGRLGPVACLGVVVALPLAAAWLGRRRAGGSERGAPALAAMSVAMVGIAGLELAALAPA